MGWIERHIPHDRLGERTITLTDSGGGPETFTLTATDTITAALADLQGQANASGVLNGTYTFALAAETTGVTLSCTENFTVTFTDNMGKTLGFVSGGPWAGATSYTDDTPAGGWADCFVGFDAIDVEKNERLREYRHGRHDAWTHAYTRKVMVNLWINAADWTTQEDTPLLDGLFRIHCTASASPYSFTNPDGYLDVYPYDRRATHFLGSDEGQVAIELLGTVTT
jgi:hypothetical protein